MKLTVVGSSGSYPGPDSPASCYLLTARHQGRDFNILLDLVLAALGPEVAEHVAMIGHLDLGAAELAMLVRLNLAAQLVAHRLLAVADAEDRQARFPHDLRRLRPALGMHRMRRAGKDDAARLEVGDALRVAVEGEDLAIDPRLAQPPRDELGHLRAEIEDEDAVGHLVGSLTLNRGRMI